MLPTAIGYGLILAGPLGSEQAGIMTALLGSVIAGAVMALIGRSGALILGGNSAATLLVAGSLAAMPHDLGTGLGFIMLVGGLANVLVAGMAMTGFGGVVAQVPYPVLAGVLNGTAILMVLSMQRHVLPVVGWTDWSAVHWGSVAVAGCVVGILLFARRPRWLGAVPMVLVAMVAGTALHYGLAWAAVPGVVGPVLRQVPGVGTVGADWVLAVDGLARADWPALLGWAGPVAVSVAFLTIIETMTTTSALRDVTGRASEPRSTLLLTAVSGLAAGAGGGMPAMGSISSTMSSVLAGGTTPLAPLLRSVFLASFVLALSLVPLQLPLAAMAGVVIAGGLRLFDLNGLRLIWVGLRRGRRNRGELVGSALVIVAVTGVAVHWSLVAAVGVGILLSLGVFAMAMARGVVRRTYPSPPGRSRTGRTAADAAALLSHGGAIAVVEVEGVVFFGSVEEIATRVSAAVAGGASFVVVDMRRVTRLDLSGARRLVRTVQQARAGGMRLTLAYVRPGLPVWDYLDQLDLLRGLDAEATFFSLDAALQSAEERLLSERGGARPTVDSPEAALLGLGLSTNTAAAMLPHVQELTLAAGERVIGAGERAEAMFLLLDGQLDVVVPVAGSRALSPRLATVGAGTLFGEMALVSGEVRSADVVARTAARCLRIGVDTMDMLRLERPEAALDLMASVARQMERNLRLANLTIRSLEE